MNDVDPSTLAFGPSGATIDNTQGPHYDDVNGDEVTDLLAHFRTAETGLALTDEEACLTGENFAAMRFEACDSVQTVPGCGLGFELVLLLPPLMLLRRRRSRRIG